MATKTKPELTEGQKEIAADLKTQAALEAVAKSEGGKLLVAGYLSDIVGSIDTLAIRYHELTHAELMGYCASLKANLDSYRAMKNAPYNRRELEETLKLALNPPDPEGEE